jgi:Flp pilus assembly protein TadD/predicted aspartyl protease
MQIGTGRVAFALLVGLTAAASLGLRADAQQSAVVDIQYQLATELFAEGRYVEALDAYQRAVAAATPDEIRRPRAGLIVSALRLAEFDLARREAELLVKAAPRDADAVALYADAMWSSGLFEEAEARYEEAFALNPEVARARHGRARALAGRSKLPEAMEEAQAALRLAPRDLEIHHTIGAIYERMRRFEEAAGAFSNYVNLLPNKDRSDKADWSRSEIKFLRSFGQRVPYELDPGTEDQLYTVDFRLVNDKVIVRAKVNEGSFQDFVVDTGAENTILSGPTAQRLGVTPITYTLSAGVGDVGLRGLQLARINTLELGPLKLRNVPCMIKDPPLRNLPVKESESLSPLALGFSMIIDYKTRKITFGKKLEPEQYDFQLPLRMHRLAMVRGMVDGRQPANFVVDTGGEVISISQAIASSLQRPAPTRRIALQVFGSSGWDRDAFLLPGVDLTFDRIQYTNFPVVVLNLNTPSALLGFRLGGIVGHKFLSRYRVAIDLERSVLGLKQIS